LKNASGSIQEVQRFEKEKGSKEPSPLLPSNNFITLVPGTCF